ncbi:hypothetical protein Tco_0057326, partial [Tanacetum coccineum]
MNNKKHILNLDQFRDILQICPKFGNKKFEEPPLKKEILSFLASLGHSGEIRKITDVNVNKLHQPWRSFVAIINKCLNGKPSYDSLRLSQAQILWGILRTKIRRRAKELETIFEAGKGKQKAKELETIFEAVMTEAEQLKTITKRSRKETHSSHVSGSGADEGTGVSPGVPDAPDYDSDDVISWKSSEDDQADDKNDDDENAQDDANDDKNDDDENAQDDANDDKNDDDENVQDDDDEAQTESEDDGDDFIHPKLKTHDDETTHEEETDEDDSFDPIVHTPS